MQLLNESKEKRDYRKLKRETPNHIQWRTRFGRGYGPVVRHTNVRMVNTYLPFNPWKHVYKLIVYYQQMHLMLILLNLKFYCFRHFKLLKINIKCICW
jgi:hypothetical protein